MACRELCALGDVFGNSRDFFRMRVILDSLEVLLEGKAFEETYSSSRSKG